MSLNENLHWRYATKKMTGDRISAEQLNQILENTRLAASSYGLQPYTILVVSNPDVKAKLSPAAYNQPQIIGSSELLVFCVPEIITQEYIDAYIQNVADTRGLAFADLQGFNDTIAGTLKNLTVEETQVWSAKQAYIALGTALAAAAELKVDATPMEGFSKDDFDKILGLKEKGLKSMVIMALGVRSEDDALAKAPKVRKSKEDLFSFID